MTDKLTDEERRMVCVQGAAAVKVLRLLDAATVRIAELESEKRLNDTDMENWQAANARAEAAEQWNVTLQNARDTHASEAASLRAEVEQARRAEVEQARRELLHWCREVATATALLERCVSGARRHEWADDVRRFLSSTPAPGERAAAERKVLDSCPRCGGDTFECRGVVVGAQCSRPEATELALMAVSK